MSIITGLDHLVVAVADPGVAAESFRRLGLNALPPNLQADGSGTALVRFADGSFLELMRRLPAAPTPVPFPPVASDGTGAALDAGLVVVALGSADAHGLHAALGAFATGAPVGFLDLPDGQGGTMPATRLVGLDDRLFGLAAFAVQYLIKLPPAPPEAMAHEATATGIEGITVLHDDPSACRAPLAALLGDAALHAGQGRLDVAIGRHTLRLLTPARFAGRYPGIAFPAFFTVPHGAVITLKAKDLGAVRKQLAAEGLRPIEARGERVAIAPRDACGVIVEFCLS